MNCYDKYFSTHAQYVTGISVKAFELERRAFAKECGRFLPENREARILDVGCGVGHFLYFLERSGYQNYLGIDTSPEQVAFCQENITDKVEMADAFEFLKSKPSSFDVIFSSNFVEHFSIDQLLTFTRLVNFSLKAEGIVILRTTNLASPFKAASFWDDVTHITPFTERSLKQLLRLSQFEDVQVYPSACSLPHQLALAAYKLLMLVFWVRPARIVTPAIIGVGRKAKNPSQPGADPESLG